MGKGEWGMTRLQLFNFHLNHFFYPFNPPKYIFISESKYFIAQFC